MPPHFLSDSTYQTRTIPTIEDWRSPTTASLRARNLLYFAAALIGIVHVLTELEGTTPFQIHFGSIQIYLFDLLAIGLGGMGSILFLRRRQITRGDLIFGIIVLLSVVQFIRGSALYGTQAGVEFRQDAFVLSGLLFMMGASNYYKYSRRDFMVMVAIYACAALFIYGIRALGFAPLGVFDLKFNLGTWRAQRFIRMDEAFGILCLALTCFSLAIQGTRTGSGSRPDRVLKFWLFGAIAIVLSFSAMHRSVWAATLVVLPLFFALQLRYQMMRKRDFEISLVAAIILIGVIAAALMSSATIQNAIAEMSERNSTLNWRTEGWGSLLALLSPSDYLIGRGYGADYTHLIMGQLVNHSAHSYYVGKLWQHGVFGLAINMILYVYVIGNLVKIARKPKVLEDRALATLLMALIGGELVFFIVYANWIPSVLIMGYSLGFVRSVTVASMARHHQSFQYDPRIRYWRQTSFT